MSRTFAIGDIHGCDVALETLLSKLGLTSTDTCVVLGDVIDRGPDSKRVIEQLIDLQQNCRLILLIGNHEEMLFDALADGPWKETWPLYGGREMIESYGGTIEQIPEEHLDFLRNGVDYFEAGNTIFVHANLEPKVPLDKQTKEWLRWAHLTGNEKPFASGKRVICGHTALKSGTPSVFPGWACIDTFCYGGKYLTCVNVDTDEVYQARQTGSFRDGLSLKDFA
ncbi:MAG: metallophosphoesterase [Planctomycetota bacterium]|nr:metallophosphoesterase [Planctomycetota bacterium]MDA1214788.1 metallophosphoesterase [Planctomycetota bacterium]